MNLEKVLQGSGETSLCGFTVETEDGSGGVVEQVLYWSRVSVPDYIVVRIKRWVFSRKTVLPVGFIEDVDIRGRRLKISLNRQQVREAPKYTSCG
jgi:hypothetical protein